METPGIYHLLLNHCQYFLSCKTIPPDRKPGGCLNRCLSLCLALPRSGSMGSKLALSSPDVIELPGRIQFCGASVAELTNAAVKSISACALRELCYLHVLLFGDNFTCGDLGYAM